MRVICGLVAVGMLVTVSQQAWAVCLIRGGVTTCTRSFPGYPGVSEEPDKNTQPEAPDTGGKTIVLQQGGSSSDAWVVTPQGTPGAIVLGSANPAGATCGSGTSC
jgi:hypothetical protein